MGRSKKLMVVALVVGAIVLMTEPTAWAAQGQITEVNPSGIPAGISKIPGHALDVLSGLLNGVVDHFSAFFRNIIING